MKKEEIESKARKLTVRFNDNYNKKLYGNFFTTIRKKDYGLIQGDLVDIELKGNKIMLAKVYNVNTVKFHELSTTTIIMDTGLNYSDALTLFDKFGYKVSNFDLEVDYIMFEMVQVYQKK